MIVQALPSVSHSLLLALGFKVTFVVVDQLATIREVWKCIKKIPFVEKEEFLNEWMYNWGGLNCLIEWMNGCMSYWKSELRNEWIEERMNVLMNEWIVE